MERGFPELMLNAWGPSGAHLLLSGLQDLGLGLFQVTCSSAPGRGVGLDQETAMWSPGSERVRLQPSSLRYLVIRAELGRNSPCPPCLSCLCMETLPIIPHNPLN